jgi:hypothetical protein
MMRNCDSCTLCCDLLEVKDLGKAANSVCEHCDGGCLIFGQPERPAACSAYRCAWLFNESWQEMLRPDRCGVVFEPFAEDEQLCFTANVDGIRPESWKEGAAAAAIKKMIGAGCSVIVVIGEEKHVLMPEGQTPAGVWDLYERSARKLWQQPLTPLI